MVADLQALAGPLPLEQFVQATNISLRHRYAYVVAPKSACTTIKKTLIRLELEDPALEFERSEAWHQRAMLPLLAPTQVPNFGAMLKSGELFRFCFVRHPYDRLLSAYLDKISRDWPGNGPIQESLGLTPEVALSLSFPAFVDRVSEQSVAAMNPHWRVQVDQTHQGRIAYDFIGRVERLPEDLFRVGEYIGANLEQYYAPERRRDTGAAQRRAEFYTPALKAKVRDIYARDFEQFGYDD